jgi:hypothetical protein
MNNDFEDSLLKMIASLLDIIWNVTIEILLFSALVKYLFF